MRLRSAAPNGMVGLGHHYGYAYGTSLKRVDPPPKSPTATDPSLRSARRTECALVVLARLVQVREISVP